MVQEIIEKITRKEAKAINQKWYYTGVVCKNGHYDKRYTNTGICYGCKRVNSNNDYNRHKERVIKKSKKYIGKNNFVCT